MLRLNPSPSVDGVMLEHRAALVSSRSIKNTTKQQLILLALSMLDLTTLEGKDSPEKVRALCQKAMRPLENDEELLGFRVPAAAGVCVYPSLVPIAREALAGSRVKVASVATGFPSGQYPLSVRLDDTRRAVADGADEIDMVISRGLFLSGREDEIFREITETAAACVGPAHTAHLKVILETGELETYDNIRRASDIAIAALSAAGADHGFIKTSTGKVQPAATLPTTMLMFEAVRDHFLRTGEVIGVKPAGGIRTAKQALHYLIMVHETMDALPRARQAHATPAADAFAHNAAHHNGDGVAVASNLPLAQDHRQLKNQKPAQDQTKRLAHHPTQHTPQANPWLTPDFFRFGASVLANDLLRQLVRLKTGRYMAGYDFSES